jgi:hypothetical protein
MPLTPTHRDFRVEPHPQRRQAVLAIFLPTNSHYVFTIVDKAEQEQFGLLSPAYEVEHRRTGDTGDYPESEVRDMAWELALAQASKLVPP